MEENKLTKEQNMLKTLERFLEKEINGVYNENITFVNALNRRLIEVFNEFGMITLGDIFDVAESIRTGILVGAVHASPSFEYYKYGYSCQTGFNYRIMTTCIYEEDKGCKIHFMFEFDDPKIV